MQAQTDSEDIVASITPKQSKKRCIWLKDYEDARYKLYK
jgi:hypothetical protein